MGLPGKGRRVKVVREPDTKPVQIPEPKEPVKVPEQEPVRALSDQELDDVIHADLSLALDQSVLADLAFADLQD